MPRVKKETAPAPKSTRKAKAPAPVPEVEDLDDDELEDAEPAERPAKRTRKAKAAESADYDPKSKVIVVGDVPSRGQAGPIVAAFLKSKGRRGATVEQTINHIADEFGNEEDGPINAASANRKFQRLIANGYISVE